MFLRDSVVIFMTAETKTPKRRKKFLWTHTKAHVLCLLCSLISLFISSGLLPGRFGPVVAAFCCFLTPTFRSCCQKGPKGSIAYGQESLEKFTSSPFYLFAKISNCCWPLFLLFFVLFKANSALKLALKMAKFRLIPSSRKVEPFTGCLGGVLVMLEIVYLEGKINIKLCI